MNRAERRRAEKDAIKAKTKTYNFTQEQLENAVREGVKRELHNIREQTMKEAINNALILLLSLPVKVLKENYWKKTYEKKLPEFVELVLEGYGSWERGELDLSELERDLWEYGGVKFEKGEE